MNEIKSIKEQMAAAQAELLVSNPNESKKLETKKIAKPTQSLPLKSTAANKPILFVNGKLNKVDHEYINKNFFVHKGLYNEISIYCKGMDTAIFNYLLHIGLQQLKTGEAHINVDISDIENTYNNKTSSK